MYKLSPTYTTILLGTRFLFVLILKLNWGSHVCVLYTQSYGIFPVIVLLHT